jgi:hypothetical protein
MESVVGVIQWVSGMVLAAYFGLRRERELVTLGVTFHEFHQV